MSLVNFEIDEGIATITINRPGTNNSLNPVVVHQLACAFEQAASDERVTGIVLAGAGKAFAIGADIDFFVRNIESGDIERIVKFTEQGHQLLDRIEKCAKPVVARVHGAALGAGTEIVLACKFAVASTSASFGLPETGLGIYPGFGGTQRAPRAMGAGRAKWLIYTGKTISAKDAWKVGLIDQVVDVQELGQLSQKLAAGLCECEGRPGKGVEEFELETFFATTPVDDLQQAAAHSQHTAIVRSVKLTSSKPLNVLRIAERLINAAARCTLDEGLRLEIEHLTHVFSQPETHRRLALYATKRSN
jgi:enoyl-CoA hydratase/3-hydroxyacyl-CoA dehydrogenase